jgi:hypothetical protein
MSKFQKKRRTEVLLFVFDSPAHNRNQVGQLPSVPSRVPNRIRIRRRARRVRSRSAESAVVTVALFFHVSTHVPVVVLEVISDHFRSVRNRLTVESTICVALHRACSVRVGTAQDTIVTSACLSRTSVAVVHRIRSVSLNRSAVRDRLAVERARSRCALHLAASVCVRTAQDTVVTSARLSLALLTLRHSGLRVSDNRLLMRDRLAVELARCARAVRTVAELIVTNENAVFTLSLLKDANATRSRRGVLVSRYDTAVRDRVTVEDTRCWLTDRTATERISSGERTVVTSAHLSDAGLT